MEYVYSKNFIDHFENAGFEQINYFIKAFDLFIKREIENSEMKTLPFNVLLDKWTDVKKKILSNKFLSEDAEINSLISQTNIIMNQNQEDFCIPIGICHGDLTFSNILLMVTIITLLIFWTPLSNHLSWTWSSYDKIQPICGHH